MKDNYYFNDKYFLGIPFVGSIESTNGPPLVWFKPEHFRQVLTICRDNGLGVMALEVWVDGACADTVGAKECGADPFDSRWFSETFERLSTQYAAAGAQVLFSAFYEERSAIGSWWKGLFSK